MEFSTIQDAIEEVRRGGIVIVVDDEDRENEGDLTVAAEKVSPEAINFMAKHGRGLICLAMKGDRLDQLQLPLMVEPNTSKYGTAFTVSIDAAQGVTTGISAADRAVTIRKAINPSCVASDLVRPGHVFPLRARPGGVLERAGQTEAAVDLAHLAGLIPSGVICEIMNEDGSMARVPELARVARQHGLKMITVADLIAFRLQTETFVRRVIEGILPTEFGEFRTVVFENTLDHMHHLALLKGEIKPKEPVLVRVQTQSTLDDVFHTLRNQDLSGLHNILKQLSNSGPAILIYLRQEGTGVEIADELRLLTSGPGNARGREPDALKGRKGDPRVYGIGAQMLQQLGVRELRLLTNHPRRMSGLQGYGLIVVEHVRLPASAAQ